jgi:hypothetical protein
MTPCERKDIRELLREPRRRGWGEGGVRRQDRERLPSATPDTAGWRIAHPSARDLPVHREVFPAGGDEVGVPCRSGDLGVLVGCLGALAVDVSVFGLRLV